MIHLPIERNRIGQADVGRWASTVDPIRAPRSRRRRAPEGLLRFWELRRLELAAGAPRGKAEPGIWSANKAMRQAERELARQGEVAYKRTVTDWQRAEKSKGAGVTTGRASNRPSEGKAARQTNSP